MPIHTTGNSRTSLWLRASNKFGFLVSSIRNYYAPRDALLVDSSLYEATKRRFICPGTSDEVLGNNSFLSQSYGRNHSLFAALWVDRRTALPRLYYKRERRNGEATRCCRRYRRWRSGWKRSGRR